MTEIKETLGCLQGFLITLRMEPCYSCAKVLQTQKVGVGWARASRAADPWLPGAAGPPPLPAAALDTKPGVDSPADHSSGLMTGFLRVHEWDSRGATPLLPLTGEHASVMTFLVSARGLQKYVHLSYCYIALVIQCSTHYTCTSVHDFTVKHLRPHRPLGNL